MLAMTKAKPKHAMPATPDGDKVRTRRRAGTLEFWDEHQQKWIAREIVATLLDRLLGERKITENEFLSGLRFAARFEMAGLGAKYGAISPDAMIVDGGKQWREPLGGSPMARSEVDAALEYVGGFGAECLVWLLGMDEGIEAFTWRCRSSGRLIHVRAVQYALVVALGSLGGFYRRERRHGEER